MASSLITKPCMMITKVDNNDYDNHNGLTPNPSGAPPRRRLPSQGHCLFPLIALIADICVDHIVNYFKKKLHFWSHGHLLHHFASCWSLLFFTILTYFTDLLSNCKGTDLVEYFSLSEIMKLSLYFRES